MNHAHPILSCRQSIDFERRLLGGVEAHEWDAMNRAGRSLGRAILRDYREIGPIAESLHILALLGTGHNAGDALIACEEILQCHPGTQIFLLFVFGPKGLKPLTRRCFDNLLRTGGESIKTISWTQREIPEAEGVLFPICIDGILGMQFRPPIRPPGDAVVEWINKLRNVRMRAAVDLPSGVGDSCAQKSFRADFTYATGIAKEPLFDPANAPSVGRVRYLDIGFFESDLAEERKNFILQPSVLDPLRGLRPPQTDKRSYGHLFILGGSRSMPGAILMAVRAALKSGVGLLTAFVPESVAAQFAAVAPEAMWVPWPETPEGGLALEGFHLLEKKISRATAILVGPGMGPEKETRTLIDRVVKEILLPIVLDADALQPEIVNSAASRPSSAGSVVLTPHMGEFNRISESGKTDFDESELIKFCRKNQAITILKGSFTRICDGSRIMVSPFGGPLLARGGSGDILSGLVGSRVAPPLTNPFKAACQAVAWHGLAADALAREEGPTAVTTTDVLPYLSAVLRNE